MSRYFPRRPKRSFRPVFDAMEQIALLSTVADLAMISSTATSLTSVTANYQITGAAITGPLTFNIYRSSTASYTASNLQAIDTLSVSANRANLSVGVHSVKLSLNAESLPPDPNHEFVIVVANPGKTVPESNYTNDSAYFQIFVVGAISHGLELATSDPSGAVPAWESAMASSLSTVEKYNSVLAFNWVATSDLPVSGEAVAAGLKMSQQVASIAAWLQSIHPGDIVDYQFIGHSRGAVVVSQAIQDIVKNDPSAFSGSYIKMTLLDPHPALESSAHSDYMSYNASSFSGNAEALAVHGFQSVAADPPVVIPSIVNTADVFYQQNPYSAFPAANSESVLNLWGHGNDGTITNLTPTAPTYHSLTGINFSGIGIIGHSEMPLYYLDAVVNAGLSLAYS